MTSRLLISVNGAQGEMWKSDVLDPAFNAGAPYRRLSPKSPRHAFLELVLIKTQNQGAQLQLIGAIDQAQDFFAEQTLLLAPIGEESPISEAGFVLVDENLHPIRRYAPIEAQHQGGREETNWRFELAMRDAALFIGVATEKGTVRSEETCVQLIPATPDAPPDAQPLWLNPLIFAFQGDLRIPGIASADPATDFARAIREAIAVGFWTLVVAAPRETRRRFVGWRALFAEGQEEPSSLLRDLFARQRNPQAPRQIYSSPLADLATLDEMGGTFHNSADAKGEPWTWTPQEEQAGVQSEGAQLCGLLSQGLGLAKAPQISTLHLYDWSHNLGATQLDLTPIAAAADLPVAELLAKIAATQEVTSKAPHVAAALRRLAEQAKKLTPQDAREIFAPVLDGAFHKVKNAPANQIDVDLHALEATIASDFLAPRSPILAALNGPALEGAERSSFDRAWAGRACDLFEAPGGGAVELLRTLMARDAARLGDENPQEEVAVGSEAEYDSRWWSAFWLHCVAGDRKQRFRLVRRSGLFILNQSKLDGPELLAGGTA